MESPLLLGVIFSFAYTNKEVLQMCLLVFIFFFIVVVWYLWQSLTTGMVRAINEGDFEGIIQCGVLTILFFLILLGIWNYVRDKR